MMRDCVNRLLALSVLFVVGHAGLAEASGFSSWTNRIWSGSNWAVGGDEFAQISVSGSQIEYKNLKKDDIQYVRMIPLKGDFEVKLEVKGGYKVGIAPTGGADKILAKRIPADGKWHKLVMTRKSGKIVFQLDGVVVKDDSYGDPDVAMVGYFGFFLKEGNAFSAKNIIFTE